MFKINNMKLYVKMLIPFIVSIVALSVIATLSVNFIKEAGEAINEMESLLAANNIEIVPENRISMENLHTIIVVTAVIGGVLTEGHIDCIHCRSQQKVEGHGQVHTKNRQLRSGA